MGVRRKDMIAFMENLKNWSLWLRGVFILILGVATYYLLTYVIFLIAFVQFVVRFVMGHPNQYVSSFGHAITDYITKSIEYMTFASDEPPAPFDQIAMDTKKKAKTSGKKS